MGTQQTKPLTMEEDNARLRGVVVRLTDAELQMLARASRAEDECERLRQENDNLKFMTNADTYVVTVLGGSRIYGRRADVESIQKAIDLALSRGCSHCSESIAKARAVLGEPPMKQHTSEEP